MKKLKIAMCALLVLCSGFIFAACGDTDKNFDVSKIKVGETTQFTYDGKSHIIEVDYNDSDLDVDVEYAVTNSSSAKVDKDDFDDEINLKNAGTYYVYYKLSADGYNDYISNESTKLTILPKSINISINDVYQLMSDGITDNIETTFTAANGAIVAGDNLVVDYAIGSPLDNGEAFNKTTVQPGRFFKVTAESMNPNYIVNGEGKLYITDLVEVKKGTTTNYYGDLKNALNEAEAESVVKINKDIEIDETLNITNSITIDGQGKYSIKASDDFEDPRLILMDTANVELTLKNITLDGNAKTRCVQAKKGKLILEDTHITNGKAHDFVGGVYVTANAQFVMTGGSIKNNTFTDDNNNIEYYEKYSTDLWIGANAIGAVNEITNAEIGNIFVNANSYSQYGQGSFTLNGGEVDTIYVEYHNGEADQDYGAIFNYKAGEIEHLLVSTTLAGEFAEISTPKEETTITSGIIGTATDAQGFTKGFIDQAEFANYSYEHLDDYKKVYLGDSYSFMYAVNSVQEIVLIDSIDYLSSTLTISLNPEHTNSVIINGQGKYSIKANSTFSGDNMFNITGNANAVVTFKDITLDGNDTARVIRIDSGKLVIDNATITKGFANEKAKFVGGVFVTSSASFEMISGSITGNSYVGATATDEYYKVYSTDLWIGANAIGSMAAINGGTVGKIYVNANEYSATNKGYFTMNNGNVESVYVEYDDTFGAEFNFVGGEIGKLYLSTQTTGTFQTIENPTTGTYNGGTGVVA